MADPAQTVEQALASRRSTRAFLDRPVPRDLVNRILAAAARAPSGSNIQPWKVHVLAGDALQHFIGAVQGRFEAGDEGSEEYAYYPRAWRDPYLSRRRKVGWDLYSSLGIEKGDKPAMARQLGRNYSFFGAPVGLIFTIDRDMEQGSWLDYGMFLQSIMLAARGLGLDTCPQQAFARYHATIGEVLGLPADEMVVCGMALGFADEAAAENNFPTQRMALTEFVRYHE